MNIYVGNLSFNVTEEELRAAFAPYGEITSARIITDKMSGQSRGFGFVEMASKTEAEAAIEQMNGKEFMGRNITANEARPRPEGGRSGGNARRGGGGFSSGGGGRRGGGFSSGGGGRRG